MELIKQQALINEAHENAVKHGFWEENPSNEHFLCLILCELAEAVEAKRKERLANWDAYSRNIEASGMPLNDSELADVWQRVLLYEFEFYIKDSLGDELADAYIRMCDLAGANEVQVKEHKGMRSFVVARDASFTENVLAIASLLTDNSLELRGKLVFCMEQVERLAEIEQVDLLKHIEAKMQYNKYRAYKHGKAF